MMDLAEFVEEMERLDRYAAERSTDHDIAVQYLDATLGGEASDEEFEVEVAKLAPEIAYYRAITALDPARPRARAEKPAAKGSKPRAVPETEGPPAETGAASGDSAS